MKSVPETLRCTVSRFNAPGVSSPLFAPPQQNYSLSVVSLGVGLVEALTLEWSSGVTEPGADPVILGRLLTSAYRAQAETGDLVIAFSPTSSVTLSNVSDAIAQSVPQVAARRFPFVSHYDLLKSPVEGAFFDPDDFVER